MMNTPLQENPKSDSAMAPTPVGGLGVAPHWDVRHRLPYRIGDPVDDVVATEEITFSDTCRTSLPVSKLHKMHRIVARQVTVKAAMFFTYAWQWGLFCDAGEFNRHWHTSLLKRWLCSFIRACGYDAYSFAGQPWLENVTDGPAVLTCALATGYLNQNLKALQRLGVPILAVVEDYQEGYHADAEYQYTCINGLVKGHSNGKDRGWYDENIFAQMRDGPIGDGWFIHTIASLGPQRVVVLDTFASSNAVPLEPFPTDTSDAFGRVNRMSCPLKLDLEIPCGSEETALPGYQPAAFERLNVWPWRRYVTWIAVVSTCTLLSMMLLWLLCNVHIVPYLGTVIAVISVVAAAVSMGTIGVLLKCYRRYASRDLCPEYYLVDSDASDFIAWCSGVRIFKHRGYSLPPGFYHIDDATVTRVPPSHPDCNYTNLIAMAEQYCASKSWNPKTGVRKLIRLFGPVPEMFFQVSSADINVRECELPPDLVRTIPVRVKINPSEPKVRIASLDYNHEDFTLPVPDAQSIASTATTRVFQRIEEAPALARLLDFWKKVVRGGRLMFNPNPPDFSGYAGPKRRLYEATYEKLCSRKPAHYSSFLKIECLPSANITAGKAIRAIEPNSKSFNVSCFNFFHDFEKTLLATQDQWGYDLFAKGSNMDRRCEVIAQKAARYAYVYSCDFKNFDGHHKGKAYLDEIEFYMRIGLDRFYQSSLSDSRLDGLYEAAQPKRHSGDLFTGSGNCLVVASMLYWKGCEHTIYCDGDDTLVFTNDPNLIDVLVDRARKAGHILTVERPTRGPFGNEIPFCQHIFCGDQYWASQKRICNKLFNIPYSSTQDLEKRLYGKMCALSAYIAAGVINLPNFPCPVDEEIAWRYAGGVRRIPEPTQDPPPAGPITSLIRTLIEKCQPRPIKGLCGVINGAPLSVKLVVHQFISSDPTFKVQPSRAESFGSLFRHLVIPASRSAMFNSQFGSANFVDCTKRTKSEDSKSSSSLPTTLSPMVFSQYRTTTTQPRDHRDHPRQCSNKQDRAKRESTKPSKSQSQRSCSDPRRQDDSPRARTATSSTRTSGSPQATRSSQSACSSSTKPHSTHHNPTKNSQPIPPRSCQSPTESSSNPKPSPETVTTGTSQSAPATRTNSPPPSPQSPPKTGSSTTGSGSSRQPKTSEHKPSSTLPTPQEQHGARSQHKQAKKLPKQRSPSAERRRNQYFKDSRKTRIQHHSRSRSGTPPRK